MKAADKAWLLAPASRRQQLLAVLRAVARHRRMAAPLSYMALAGLVLALGVTAQAVLGWRWWLVVAVLAVVAEAGVVAVSLARSGESEQFADELLAVVTPRRQARRRARRQATRVRSAPFAVYGLDRTWPGPRFLSGLGTRRVQGERRPRTTSIELGHGDPRGPFLLVEVAAEEPLTPTGWRQHLTVRLAAITAEAPGAPAAAPGAPSAVPGAPSAPTSWRQAEIPVDGMPVTFDLLAEGHAWVARAEHRGLVLTLTARDLPPTQVALTRITDPDPYLPGAPRSG